MYYTKLRPISILSTFTCLFSHFLSILMTGSLRNDLGMQQLPETSQEKREANYSMILTQELR